MSKFGRFRVSSKADRTVFGICFDSKGESQHYLYLLSREKAGEISNIRLQVEFVLQEGFMYAGKKERPIKFTIDFCYYDNKRGCDVYEEFKGFKTVDYSLRRRLFLFKFPHLVYVEVVQEPWKKRRKKKS